MKLMEIQAASLGLSPAEQDALRIWLDEAPLDLDQDSPEREAKLLKAVQGPHTPYSEAEMRAACERIAVEKPPPHLLTRWRCTEWNEGRLGVEFYDHDADPREFTNLAADPRHTALLKQLRIRLAQQLPAKSGSL